MPVSTTFNTLWRPQPWRALTGRAPFEKLAFSVREFCELHSLSRGHYYNLRRQGLGPVEAKLGTRTIITGEAAARWRAQLTATATPVTKA
jgi:hypothetical protein